jgi:hypothetical protein
MTQVTVTNTRSITSVPDGDSGRVVLVEVMRPVVVEAKTSGIQGPPGPNGTVTLDPSEDNILTYGPNGLKATSMWQTTDW